MKRGLNIFIVLSLILIMSLTFVSAGWFSDLFHKNKITGKVVLDETPRVAYWCGKVNQHTENGVWMTDPDGVSGCDLYLDNLNYCRKFYPGTTSVEKYQLETITAWRESGNTGGPYTSTRQSYKCVASSLKANGAVCSLDSECISGACDYDIFTGVNIDSSNKYCHSDAAKCLFYVGWMQENDVGCTRCTARKVVSENEIRWEDFIATCGADSKWENYVVCTGSTPHASSPASKGSCSCSCVECGDNSHCSGSTPYCINNKCSVSSCVPNCVGKVCGNDGCGGSCGSCPSGYTCNLAGKCNLISANECFVESPKDLAGNYILFPIDNPYYQNHYARMYCNIVKNCGGFDSSSIVVKDDAVKACACEDYSACSGYKCVDNVALDSDFGRMGSVICTNCPSGACGIICTPSCTGKQCGDNGCGGVCGICSAGYSCNSTGQCVVSEASIKNLSISVSTQKNVYFIGEQIELTDPPLGIIESSKESESLSLATGLIVSSFEDKTAIKTNSVSYVDSNSRVYSYSNILNNEIINGNMKEPDFVSSISRDIGVFGNNVPQNLFEGYIIEFDEAPVIVEAVRLNDRASKNVENMKGNPEIVKTVKSWFVLMPEDVKDDVESYSSNVKRNNNRIKSRILTEIDKSEGKNSVNGGIIARVVGTITGNAVNQNNVKINAEFTTVFNGVVMDISNEEAEKIKNIWGVKNVYPNYLVNITLMDSVPLINADDVWKLDADGNDCSVSGKECLTGKGVTIGIIDTGIDYTHPDLGGCYGAGCKVIGGYDFINNDNDPMDDHGHGTHVAATAAGNAVLKGVAPDAKLYAFKVLDAGGSGYSNGVIEGINRAADLNNNGIPMEDKSDYVDIISLSLGGPGNPDDPTSQAIDNVVDAGIVAVIAAGNSGPSEQTILSPGTARKAITVGATYKKDYAGTYWGDINPRVNQVTRFSSRGPVIWTDEQGNEQALIKPDIVAPGALICAARYDSIFPQGQHPYYYPCIDEKHVQLAGTSMATPHVAGVVALLKQKNPDWTPAEIKSSLKNTAVDIGENVLTQGAGRVDVLKTVGLMNKPLIAEVLTNGKFLGINLDIIGIAKGEGFEKYTLYFSPINEGLEWVKICSSNQQKDNSVLCNWNAENLDEKKYYLKLDVFGDNVVFSEYGIIEIKNTEISSPFDLKDYKPWLGGEGKFIWRSDEPIEIYGIASGKNFEKYSLEWCDEDYLCSQKGLSYSGNTNVKNGLLGIWNLPADISSGFYNIKLINNYNGKSYSDEIKIYIETDLLKGWPRDLIRDKLYVPYYLMNQPTIADINGDGKNDLIIAFGTSVDVVDGFGNSLPGWPVKITNNLAGQPNFMQYGPAVGDVNNDGNLEIVIRIYGGDIYIFNKDGNYLVSPKRVGGGIGAETLTLADINNNGDLEIIWSDSGRNSLYVVDKDLNLLEGFPKYLSPPEGYFFQGSYSSVSVADLNNDRNLELIVGSSSCKITQQCWPTGGIFRIWVFDNQGNVLNGWPKEVNNFSNEYLFENTKNFVIADINKDGNRDIIFGTWNGSVFALDYNGENIEGWPISIYNFPEGCAEEWKNYISILGVSVGDINLDGNIEVVFSGQTVMENTMWGSWIMSCLFVYNNEGNILNGFPVCPNGINFRTNFVGKPTIANMDDDLEMEIISLFNIWWSDNGFMSLYAVNPDGSIVEGFPKKLSDPPFSSNFFPVADINGDGKNDLIIGKGGYRGATSVYSLKGISGNDSWPQFQHDSQHTGCYDCDKTVVSRPPQSKIVNNGDSNVTGILLMKLQKESGTDWVDEQIVTNAEVVVPAKNLIKLDVGGDYGWNLKDVTTNRYPGVYRVYASFSVGAETLESSWEFVIKDIDISPIIYSGVTYEYNEYDNAINLIIRFANTDSNNAHTGLWYYKLLWEDDSEIYPTPTTYEITSVPASSDSEQIVWGGNVGEHTQIKIYGKFSVDDEYTYQGTIQWGDETV